MCYLYHKPLCIQLGKARENGKNHLVFFTGPVLPFDRVRLIPCWERLHSGAVREHVRAQAAQVITHLHFKPGRVNRKHISNQLEHESTPCTVLFGSPT